MDKKNVPAILLLTLLFCSSCTNKQQQAQSLITVKVAHTTLTETSQRKEFPFIAKPLRTSELSFRVSGPIDRFEVYAGNHYKRDNIIAEIDPRDFRLRLENAEAAYRQATSDFERIEALYNKGNVSASSFEQARAGYIAAKTTHNKAVNELNDTRMLAPFDGYVGEVYIEKYQDVKASQPIVSLVDISKLRIEIYVAQDIAMQAKDIRNVSLSFDNQPNKVFNAEVVECARSTTPNNLSYLLTALLPNPNGKLPSGLSGKVFFDLPGSTSQTITIPQTAVCNRPTEGEYVWVVDQQSKTVSQRSISLGELQPAGRVSVKAGLVAGEVVATSSLRFLSEGASVEISDSKVVQPIKTNVK